MNPLRGPEAGPAAWPARAPRRDRLEPLPGHALRDPGSSAKHCRFCGARQHRRVSVFGPMPESDCLEYQAKAPKRSDKPYWKALGLAWLVSPPVASESRWYVVLEDAVCRGCGTHIEKHYRRRFGRLARLGNWMKWRLKIFLGWRIELELERR